MTTTMINVYNIVIASKGLPICLLFFLLNINNQLALKIDIPQLHKEVLQLLLRLMTSYEWNTALRNFRKQKEQKILSLQRDFTLK